MFASIRKPNSGTYIDTFLHAFPIGNYTALLHVRSQHFYTRITSLIFCSKASAQGCFSALKWNTWNRPAPASWFPLKMPGFHTTGTLSLIRMGIWESGEQPLVCNTRRRRGASTCFIQLGWGKGKISTLHGISPNLVKVWLPGYPDWKKGSLPPFQLTSLETVSSSQQPFSNLAAFTTFTFLPFLVLEDDGKGWGIGAYWTPQNTEL